MVRFVSVVVGLFILSGCAEWDRAVKVIAVYGAEAATREHEAARWAYCKTVTGGELERKFRNDPKGLVLWVKNCWRDSPKLRDAMLKEIEKDG